MLWRQTGPVSGNVNSQLVKVWGLRVCDIVWGVGICEEQSGGCNGWDGLLELTV